MFELIDSWYEVSGAAMARDMIMMWLGYVVIVMIVLFIIFKKHST